MGKKLSKNGIDFIDDAKLDSLVKSVKEDKVRVREIIAKSMEKKPLAVEETAVLLSAESPDLVEEIFNAARQLKKDVYGNRIVIFAPLYIGNYCINDCVYCAFRRSLRTTVRKTLNQDELVAQIEALEDSGHKRLILVFGEHPNYTADFMADTVRTVYSIRKGHGEIRRVNINAAPMDIAKLKKLKEAGIGTYQVFQETYHRETYSQVHPANTLKGNYRWRLYALHRALEAGLDDVAIGALFGLYDWKFEVMGLLKHTHDLERQFGIGPHTISFPRMTPALGSWLSDHSEYILSDDNMKKVVAVLRLSVPTAGLIVTAREKADIKLELLQLGCTQTDASTRIGIGAYSDQKKELNKDKEQFTIGDPRDLDEVIREVGKLGYISSFCTAGYRCGRTGETIMGMLSHCVEGKYCKLNAVLTYREYLNDYASPETKEIGEKLIQQEIAEIEGADYFKQKPHLLTRFRQDYGETLNGKRDLFI